MKTRCMVAALLVLCLGMVYAQTEAGSLIMVRCDKTGTRGIIPSQDIKLDHLQAAFDVNLDTFVFVHGYMTNYDGAKSSYEPTTSHLRSHLGKRNYVGFHWPSKWITFGTAVARTKEAGDRLLYVLTKISGWYGGNGRRIHLITHSLGGRVALHMLQHNEARYLPLGYSHSMAAAVHNDSFQAAFVGTNEPPSKTYVYYSGRDGVLKYLYTIYYILFGSTREIPVQGLDLWTLLPFEQQVAILSELEGRINKGNGPQNELESFLVKAMDEAMKKAMGLDGALSTSKVENINMEDYISAHVQYWGNADVMRVIASKK